MAKITNEDRDKFAELSQPHKDAIEKIFAREKAELAEIEKGGESSYRKLKLCEDMIEISQLYVAINTLSVSILSGVKNNEALNESRKMLYKAIIYLEEVVTGMVDVEFSELDDKLEKIVDFPLEKRYYLVRKLGLAIRLLVDSFGNNTKWRWSFVEIEGRFSIVMKNLLDWKMATKAYFDSSTDEYDIVVNYIRLLNTQIDKAAREYRDRYELSTHRLEDMRFAINYTLAKRKIAIVTDDQAESDELKKRATTWLAKLEHDQKIGTAS